ncbi:NADP-dependent 3-hydroxy acid dehydrogenase YdfG [Pseudoduganella lurida]|uniref:NADP-dependent 3-hydroxy acid dehydrogenase YdfG n=1 Tax=Pseudoduganella lurida TaxID=1036180 RepID=A0A562QX79_9BURK|nr:SDR family NAD(P)-dependent oxidoreductase [Pseudoduganella lurida]TWI61448.1 NADP-dependent 3-hydroxy acid dehydrogenase YdfG [Pseudoduganella lurida]
MRIMIIGGTRGIGLALAEHYSKQGATLALCGRDPARLAGHPLANDPHVTLHAVEITDRASAERAMDSFGPLDLLIVTAGAYTDAAAIAADKEATLPVLHTNVVGLCHAFDAASARMRRQGHGQLVVLASIAGLLKDYPGASLYSASKRAALAICDTYRKALAPFGIAVTAIVPGYVDTARLRELNDGDAGRKPFLQTEAQAVRHIVGAIARREARYVFPWQLHVLVRLFNLLPRPLQAFRKK